jgi:hypothetical protein
MTDFIRTIWQNAAAAQSAAGTVVKVKTEVQPVDQIRLPPVAADATAEAAVVEKQRLVKVEVVDASPVSPEASKAQRAARRDVVNARRDKRKTMSTTTPALMATNDHSGSSSDADSAGDVSMDEDEGNDKLKKMKTGKTTSVVVSPSSAGSPSSGAAAPPRKSSISMSMLNSLTAELDPSGEERLRAMEAQLEHLDPDSKEAKKKRRLIRNRMSAQLHRERKKAYVGQLEDQLQEKERELKLLQEKLNAMAVESTQLKQKLNAMDAPAAAAPASPTPVVAEVKPVSVVENDDVVIKKEPVFGEALDVAMEGINTIDLTSSLSENWADCLDGLDDIAEVAAEDLLSGLDDYPFGYVAPSPAAPSTTSTHHEMHAAKKNLAMMMAVMFSMTFCGNTPAVPTVTNGSAFSSMFGAHPPKELSQMSIASRIVACLEKTSWEEFQDINSWTTTAATAVAGAAVAVSADGKKKEEEETAEEEKETTAAKPDSPSAASDVTDSSDLCHSPKHEELTGFDPIDEFVYPVDDPLAGATAAMDPAQSWFDDFGHSDVEDVDDIVAEAKLSSSSKSKSMTSRLYEKLTSLWHEKNQVLLTVKDEKNAVTKRSVADMSSIRKGLESGALFDVRVGEDARSLLAKSDTQAVTFLYPLSAFADGADHALSAAAKAAASPSSGDDVMFLEVSCQLNAASAAALSL